MSDSVQILVGDCRETLATLPAGTIQAAISSPPYYGLRAYQTTPLIWGGQVGCAHQWGRQVVQTSMGHAHRDSPGGFQHSQSRGTQANSRERVVTVTESAFCTLCGAWRGELGQEPTLDCGGWITQVRCGACYVCHLVEVFRAVRRVLRSDATLWLNLGDSYSMDSKWGGYSGGTPKQDSKVVGYTRPKRTTGLGDKQLMGVPWRVAFALQADGWVLRSDCIWSKPNAMPESVTDRPTKAHEYLFLFGASAKYYYDSAAIAEPVAADDLHIIPRDGIDRGDDTRGRKGRCGQGDTRNKRTVWEVNTTAYPGAHFATFPPALVVPCLRASTRPGDTVLDPFGGTGTVAAVAVQWQRSAILCELNPAYAALAEQRIGGTQPALFVEVA